MSEQIILTKEEYESLGGIIGEPIPAKIRCAIQPFALIDGMYALPLSALKSATSSQINFLSKLPTRHVAQDEYAWVVEAQSENAP